MTKWLEFVAIAFLCTHSAARAGTNEYDFLRPYETGSLADLNGGSISYGGSNDSGHYFTVIDDAGLRRLRLEKTAASLEPEIQYFGSDDWDPRRNLFGAQVIGKTIRASLKVMSQAPSEFGSPILVVRSFDGDSGISAREYSFASLIVYDRGFVRYIERARSVYLISYGKLSDESWEKLSAIIQTLVVEVAGQSFALTHITDQPSSQIGIVLSGKEHLLADVYGYPIVLRRMGDFVDPPKVILPDEMVEFVSFLESVVVEKVGYHSGFVSSPEGEGFVELKRTLDEPNAIEARPSPTLEERLGSEAIERYRKDLELRVKNRAN